VARKVARVFSAFQGIVKKVYTLSVWKSYDDQIISIPL